jgi:hypothetical protein
MYCTTQEPIHNKQGNQRDITHYTPFVKRLLQRSQVISTGRGIALAGPMTWNPPTKRVTRGGESMARDALSIFEIVIDIKVCGSSLYTSRLESCSCRGKVALKQEVLEAKPV